MAGRGVAALLGLMALGGAYWALLTPITAVDAAVYATQPPPLVRDWHWLIPWGPYIAVVLNVLVALGLLYVTQHYNLVRGLTALPPGLYLLLQGALPGLLLDPWAALLPVVVMGGAMALFARYDNPGTNRLFALLFVGLSAALMLSWAVAWYIPLFILGLGQMRDLNPKSLLAALIGLAVPFWLGWVAWPTLFEHLQWPDWQPLPPYMVVVVLVIYAVITLTAMLAAYGIGLQRILSYRASIRSMHGFMALVAIVTVVAMCVDYTHLAVYLPVLNLCAAFQISHTLADERLPMTWPVVPLLIVIYTLIYLWQIIV